MDRLSVVMHLQEFKNRALPIRNKLFKFALRLLNNVEDAEDAVQEVYFKIWDKRDQMNQYQNIEAWCMTLVKNHCLDRIKSKAYKMTMVKMDLQVEAAEDTPHQIIEKKETVKVIKNLIDELPEKQKMVLHLRDIEGYSYQEISEITNLDLSMVKVNIFRARENLKKKILNQNEYGSPANRENPGKILDRRNKP